MRVGKRDDPANKAVAKNSDLSVVALFGAIVRRPPHLCRLFADSNRPLRKHNAPKLNNAWWRCTRSWKLQSPSIEDTPEIRQGCSGLGNLLSVMSGTSGRDRRCEDAARPHLPPAAQRPQRAPRRATGAVIFWLSSETDVRVAFNERFERARFKSSLKPSRAWS